MVSENGVPYDVDADYQEVTSEETEASDQQEKVVKFKSFSTKPKKGWKKFIPFFVGGVMLGGAYAVWRGVIRDRVEDIQDLMESVDPQDIADSAVEVTSF